MPVNPWLTRSAEDCQALLKSHNLLVPPNLVNASEPFCSGIWDTILCWPATLGNTTITQICPSLKLFDTTKKVSKFCHSTGQWVGKGGTLGNVSAWGWTNYFVCLPVDISILDITQEIAQKVRYCELVALSISFCALVISLLIFSSHKRLHNIRNRMHIQLMVAILLVTLIRFVLYIDGAITRNMETSATSGAVGPTINSSRYICEAAIAILEYFKCAAYAWMLCEGFHLLSGLVCHVFSGEPKLWPYCIYAWGFPVFHVGFWIMTVLVSHDAKNQETAKCFGIYYWELEYWVLEAVRLLELVTNCIFLTVIIVFLWQKVRESYGSAEHEQIKKSVKAAFMLIPLLGIPNILQLIPLKPTPANITFWIVFTFFSNIVYAMQGFLICVLYCFTNREVISNVKSTYDRYRIKHQSFDDMRRGSRGAAVVYGTGTADRLAHSVTPPRTYHTVSDDFSDKNGVITPQGTLNDDTLTSITGKASVGFTNRKYSSTEFSRGGTISGCETYSTGLPTPRRPTARMPGSQSARPQHGSNNDISPSFTEFTIDNPINPIDDKSSSIKSQCPRATPVREIPPPSYEEVVSIGANHKRESSPAEETPLMSRPS